MKNLISTFIKYRFYANILLAVMVLFGGFSLMSMKKSFFPERTTRFINISVAYPGASPEEMEQSITTRIEGPIKFLNLYCWLSIKNPGKFSKHYPNSLIISTHN